MRSFILIALALLVASCSGCQPSPTPAPPPQPGPAWFDAGPPEPFVPPPSDAGVVLDASRKLDTCQKACANEAKLKCVGSEPQCVSTCRRVVASHLTNLPLACIAKAKTCAAQAACR